MFLHEAQRHLHEETPMNNASIDELRAILDDVATLAPRMHFDGNAKFEHYFQDPNEQEHMCSGSCTIRLADDPLAVDAKRLCESLLFLKGQITRTDNSLPESLRPAISTFVNCLDRILMGYQTNAAHILPLSNIEDYTIQDIAAFIKSLEFFRSALAKTTSPTAEGRDDNVELLAARVPIVPQIWRADFDKTVMEIRTCMAGGCYIAVICLCGRICEMALKHLCDLAGKDYKGCFGIASIWGRLTIREGARDRVRPDLNPFVSGMVEKLLHDRAFTNAREVIREYRNANAHALGMKEFPDKGDATTVLIACARARGQCNT